MSTPSSTGVGVLSERLARIERLCCIKLDDNHLLFRGQRLYEQRGRTKTMLIGMGTSPSQAEYLIRRVHSRAVVGANLSDVNPDQLDILLPYFSELRLSILHAAKVLSIEPSKAIGIFLQVYNDIEYHSSYTAGVARYAPVKTSNDVQIDVAIATNDDFDWALLLQRYISIRCAILLNGKTWGEAARQLMLAVDADAKKEDVSAAALLAIQNKLIDFHSNLPGLVGEKVDEMHQILPFLEAKVLSCLQKSDFLKEDTIHSFIDHESRHGHHMRRLCPYHTQLPNEHRCLLLIAVWRRVRHCIEFSTSQLICNGSKSACEEEIAGVIEDAYTSWYCLRQGEHGNNNATTLSHVIVEIIESVVGDVAETLQRAIKL